MKHFVLLLAGLLMGGMLYAQVPGAGGPPPQGGGRPPRINYDATREVTLQGTVTTVNFSSHGPGPFVSLTFLSDGTTYDVMVGLQAVLTKQSVTLAAGDALTLVGVASTGGRGTLFMARTLTKDGTLVTLLNADGSPEGRP